MAYEKFEKVLRNVDKLSAQDVSAKELNQYLQSEGYTQERFNAAVKTYTKAKGLESDYGVIRAGLQGLTFGFSDEAEAAIKSLLNKKPYEQNLNAIQFAKQEFEATEPVKAAAAEVIGSIPTAFAAGAGVLKAGQALPKVNQFLQSLPTSLKTVAGITGAGATAGGITDCP